MPTYTYGLITIGNVALVHNNPGVISNPVVSSVFQSPTLGGTLYTEFPVYHSDRQITLKWDFMQISIYKALEALKIAGGNIPFTDELGVDWQVKMGPLTYDTILSDPTELLVPNVQLILMVVNGPSSTPYS